MKSLLRSYHNILLKYTVAIQGLQAGLLMGTGDIIAQTFVEQKSLKQVNFLRTANFTLLGVFFVGPALHKWYGFLDKYFKADGKTGVLKKVAADQLLFAPFGLATIMSLSGIMQGKSLHEIRKQLKRDFPQVLLNGYKLWPAVQLFNFYLVPLQYQVFTVQFVAIFWNAYLSCEINEGQYCFKNADPEQRKTVRVPRRGTDNRQNYY